MSKTANLDVVKSALTNHTAYELSKFLGVSEAGIGKWKNGKVELENMSFLSLTNIIPEKSLF